MKPHKDERSAREKLLEDNVRLLIKRVQWLENQLQTERIQRQVAERMGPAKFKGVAA